MKVKIILIILMFLSLTLIPLCQGEEYFEDVNIIAVGRTRTTFGWNGFHIGFLNYSAICVNHKQVQVIRISIMKNGHLIYRRCANEILIFMRNTTGLYYCSLNEGYTYALLPSSFVVLCHSEKVWIRRILL